MTSSPLLDRQAQLEAMRAGLRPGQREMAAWAGGALAVSAVPGAGKSTGMAAAAAIAIAQHQLHARHTLLLVTFTRSAAANLKAKIYAHLRTLQLPTTGFNVFTLHGLALYIATRHPELSNIYPERMTLVNLSQGHQLLRATVEQWIAQHPAWYQQLLEGQGFDGEETERLRRQTVLRTEVLPELAYTVIHEAKSSGLTPTDLLDLAAAWGDRRPSQPAAVEYPVLAIAAGLYERYQVLLHERQFLDYDEMMLAALRVLADDTARQLWQSRVFAVFEDEAQDSSPLQTRLLEQLAQTPTGELNLIRVGDPNQAINSTFTPADPVFFNAFCEQCAQQGQLATIAQAGRSSPIIIAAANFALDWVNQTYGTEGDRPFRPQRILPVTAQDPQADANPPAIGAGVEVHYPTDIYATVEQMGQRLMHLFRADPALRVAILVRENKQCRFLAHALQHPDSRQLDFDLSQLPIRIYDVSARDRDTHIPQEMLSILQFVARPHSPEALKATLNLLVKRQLIPTQDLNLAASQPEQFLYPTPLSPVPETEAIRLARRYCTGLLRARLELPPEQLLPFIGLTLQYEKSDLATLNKLAGRLAQQISGDRTLTAMQAALLEIVTSERFEPVDTDDVDSRYIQPGQVTIMTMHKAKGLDWDVVFLPFLHSRQIPGTLWVPPQRKFLGDFSLAEVARAQLRAYVHAEPTELDTASAWHRAATLKTAEEFRLLYVAMTRARRLLWLSAAQQAPFSWNKPDAIDTAAPCPLLAPLQQFLGRQPLPSSPRPAP